ncbi:DUF2397 family protein [Streptomyces sp. NPDC048680]|uniref:DUF2397 family protein n=1 Tax=Streptomyces sp. NPDC048680 TaxID=3155492 RepID=UPI00342685F8
MPGVPLSATVRDFYAYLGQVIARYDLDSGEYQGLKELLLDYVKAIMEDVSFRTPRISAALDMLWPHLPRLLDLLDAHTQGLAGLSAQSEGCTEPRVHRSLDANSRTARGLRGWFTDADGQGSQVDEFAGGPLCPSIAAGQHQANAAVGHRADIAAPGPAVAGPVVRRGRPGTRTTSPSPPSGCTAPTGGGSVRPHAVERRRTVQPCPGAAEDSGSRLGAGPLPDPLQDHPTPPHPNAPTRHNSTPGDEGSVLPRRG